MREPKRCPFCNPHVGRVLLEGAHVRAVLDCYPVAPGHALIVPKQHASSLFDCPPDVRAEVWEMVATVRAMLTHSHAPDGFTVGINDGQAAGQTVPHAHVHIIPRNAGDMTDPRGGVRRVLMERADYWTDNDEEE